MTPPVDGAALGSDRPDHSLVRPNLYEARGSGGCSDRCRACHSSGAVHDYGSGRRRRLRGSDFQRPRRAQSSEQARRFGAESSSSRVSDRERRTPGRSSCRPSRSTTISRRRAKADGSFSIAGLAADTYYAVPVREVPADGADAWQEPAFLESLIPAAMNVLVAEGSRRRRISG